MANTNAITTNGFHYPDWDNRYYHVDQVLDRPGPRTDPDSFMAGDGVSDLVSTFFLIILYAPLHCRSRVFCEVNARS